MRPFVRSLCLVVSVLTSFLRFAAAQDGVVVLLAERIIEVPAALDVHVEGQGAVVLREGRTQLVLPEGASVAVNDQPLHADGWAGPGDRVTVVLGDRLLWTLEIPARDAAARFRVDARVTDSSGNPVPDARVETRRRVIGVVTQRPERALATHLGIDPEAALLVTEVTEGLPAHRAGVHPYDLIVALAGQPPANQERLRELVAACPPEGTLAVRVLRGGQVLDLEVGVTELKVTAERTWGLPAAGRALWEAADRDATVRARLEASLADLRAGEARLTQTHAQLLARHGDMAAAEQRLAEQLAELEHAQTSLNEALVAGQGGDVARQEAEAARESDRAARLQQELLERQETLEVAATALSLSQAEQASRVQALATLSDAVRTSEEQLSSLEALRGLGYLRFVEGQEGGGRSLVLPLAAEQEAVRQRYQEVLERRSVSERQAPERLADLESRMARIEELLEELLERQR